MLEVPTVYNTKDADSYEPCLMYQKLTKQIIIGHK